MRQKTGILGIVAAICLILGLQVSSAPAAETGLLGWWKFDQGKGLVLRDSSGKENHGEIDSAAWVPGRKGPALKFDALNQTCVVLKTDPALYPTNAFTIEAWFNPLPNPEREAYILTFDYQWAQTTGKGIALYMHGEPEHTNLQLEVSNSAGRRAIAVARGLKTGTWYYCAATYDGNTITLYLDGVPVANTLLAAPVVYAHKRGGDFSIGDSAGHFNFSGLIDELRIYGRPLSPEEIGAHYAEGKKG
jgi:hypothetical protein